MLVLHRRQDSTFEGKTTFSTSVLVGKRDEPLLTIAARQLVEFAHSKGTKTYVLRTVSATQHSTEQHFAQHDTVLAIFFRNCYLLPYTGEQCQLWVPAQHCSRPLVCINGTQ